MTYGTTNLCYGLFKTYLDDYKGHILKLLLGRQKKIIKDTWENSNHHRYGKYKKMWFFLFTEEDSKHMCELNFVVSSITM